MLDEATSALDERTEREIAATIERLRGDRTIVIVAHREGTIAACDPLFHFRDGRLVDADTSEDATGPDRLSVASGVAP